MNAPTRLQLDLAERIVDLLRGDGAEAGLRLSENGLARRLNVSRTPVRAALAELARRGVITRGVVARGEAAPGEAARGDGLKLVAVPDAVGEPGPDAVDAAMVAIARDREAGALPDTLSEQEAMRRYALPRALLGKVLARLSELDMIERRPGYGWRFLQAPRDGAIQAESYRFRMLVEPAGLLEAGFRLDPAWIADMRERHETTLSQPWRETSSVGFFEMNAAFHEGLAAASGNRFIHAAIRRQNALRRLANYDWVFGTARVQVNCREHLDILAHLERGERDVAAALLRSHLAKASVLRGEVAEP